MDRAEGSRRTELRNRIVEINMGLVTQIAQTLARQNGFHHPDQMDDVRSEVALTLTEIVEDWNPDACDLGAVLWAQARTAVRRMRDLGTGWGGATGARRRHATAEICRRELAAKLGREPSIEEVSEMSGMSSDEITTMRSRFGQAAALTTVDLADSGASVAAVGESAAFVSQMAAMLNERDPLIGEAFSERFGLHGQPPPEPVPWALVAERCGVSIPTVQRRVTQGRQWVAEWLLEQAA